MLKFISIKNIFKVVASIAIITMAIYIALDIVEKKRDIMSFEDYEPISTLNVEGEQVYSAKFPFIDVHSHQWDMPLKDLGKLVKEMDELNMGYLINLSGSGFGPQSAKDLYFNQSMKNIKENQPERFGLFVNVDFESIDDENYGETQANIIRDAVAKGAIGLKVYKSLGLRNKDSNGNRIAVDDPRLDPIWDVCGKLNIPVLIHSADPFQFWLEKDSKNERWFELKEKPNRYYAESSFIPSFQTIIQEQHNAVSYTHLTLPTILLV